MKRYMWLGALVLILAGMMVTSILTWGHFNGTIGQICSANSGCNTVLTSQYSQFLGLPTALYGLLFYVVVFCLFLVYPVTSDESRGVLLDSITAILTSAFLISLGLTIYSISGLGTTCAYCLTSAGIVTLLFAGTLFWRIRGARIGEIKASGSQLVTGLILGSLVFLLSIGSLYAQSYINQGTEENANKREIQVLASDAHSIGDPAAPIRVIEFFDLACPHCQRFTLNVFPKIKSEFIETGKVLWTFRSFPITRVHPNALYAHAMLETVPPNNYLDAKKTIMRNADQWSSRYNKKPQKYFDFFAKQYSLPNQSPSEDLSDRIMNKQRTYIDMGISRTPSFIVNGKLYKGGMPFQRWQRIFNSVLKSRN